MAQSFIEYLGDIITNAALMEFSGILTIQCILETNNFIRIISIPNSVFSFLKILIKISIGANIRMCINAKNYLFINKILSFSLLIVLLKG